MNTIQIHRKKISVWGVTVLLLLLTLTCSDETTEASLEQVCINSTSEACFETHSTGESTTGVNPCTNFSGFSETQTRCSGNKQASCTNATNGVRDDYFGYTQAGLNEEQQSCERDDGDTWERTDAPAAGPPGGRLPDGQEDLVPPGGACANHSQCESGLDCTNSVCGPGLFRAEPGDGGGFSCDTFTPCYGGENCVAGVCSDGSLFSRCDSGNPPVLCQSGLNCVNNQDQNRETCRAGDLGSLCNTDAHCGSGLSCVANRCSDGWRHGSCDADNGCHTGTAPILPLSCVDNRCSDGTEFTRCDSSTAPCQPGFFCSFNDSCQ